MSELLDRELSAIEPEEKIDPPSSSQETMLLRREMDKGNPHTISIFGLELPWAFVFRFAVIAVLGIVGFVEVQYELRSQAIEISELRETIDRSMSQSEKTNELVQQQTLVLIELENYLRVHDKEFDAYMGRR